MENCNAKTFVVGKDQLSSFVEGEKKCYLITNGCGGYSSLTSIATASRRDHGLFIASKKAPNYRVHMVTNVEESVDNIPIYSQQFATRTSSVMNGKYLSMFSFKYYPHYSYKVGEVEIDKDIIYIYGENTVVVRYKVYNWGKDKHTLKINPLYRLTNKDDFPCHHSKIECGLSFVENKTTSLKCYINTNGKIENKEISFYSDMFFEYDSRDGRECIGKSFKCNEITFNIEKEEETFYIAFSDKEKDIKDVDTLFINEEKRCEDLIKVSGLKDEYAQTLVVASDRYVSERESTKGKTIMAGYPFFGDWGRDTMIALVGCVLSTKRYEDCKSILRTFASYEREGMMPNVFPEGENDEPMYNTVDAALLFINSVYLYYKEANDFAFVTEMLPVMKSIIDNYKKGTKFHIKMCEDGLITSGGGLEQLTWMDVRFGDILPTPRQGKAVEINAYWYNALIIMSLFTKEDSYKELAENKVKPNFLSLFWQEDKGYFKDVISIEQPNKADTQIRPNQVWALNLPFTMVDKEKALKTISTIYKHLYTPWGLRSLSTEDKDFHKTYGGSHFNRDMAYHQGTVWAFPMGAFYLSIIRFLDNGKEKVRRLLKGTVTSLNEGCLGQIAEIYDGENPNESQGCFAQAWSVSEILRVYRELEK